MARGLPDDVSPYGMEAAGSGTPASSSKDLIRGRTGLQNPRHRSFCKGRGSETWFKTHLLSRHPLFLVARLLLAACTPLDSPCQLHLVFNGLI